MIIAYDWIGYAPEYLLRPMENELQQLKMSELFILFLINPRKYKISEYPKLEIIIKQMQKRRDMISSIREAEKNNLYDMAEHVSRNIDYGNTEI